MRRNMKEWSQNLINSGKRYAMPIMTYPGLELTGRKIMDVITNGEEQFKCIKALADRYPSAAAVSIMDLSVEAEAFGSPINYSDKDVPTVASRIITDSESADVLKVPEEGSGRSNVYLEASSLAADKIQDRPTFGGHIGPFSLAGRLFDMTEIMLSLLLEPEIVHSVLEKCTQFLIGYCRAFKNAGVNGVIIAEPAAGLLSPQHCDEFSSRYVKRIIDAVQDSSFMVILHNCGSTKKLAASMVSTGAMGFHFGNAVDMMDILTQIPEDRLVFGNIDPARVFRNGTVEDMKQKVRRLLEKTSEYRNFVLSSGCDVPPGTPVENIEAFYAALEEYNRCRV